MRGRSWGTVQRIESRIIAAIGCLPTALWHSSATTSERSVVVHQLWFTYPILVISVVTTITSQETNNSLHFSTNMAPYSFPRNSDTRMCSCLECFWTYSDCCGTRTRLGNTKIIRFVKRYQRNCRWPILQKEFCLHLYEYLWRSSEHLLFSLHLIDIL